MTHLASKPLNQLGCPTLHFLTSFLLTDTDLMAVGCWTAEVRHGLTPTAWCRSHLHVAVQCEDAASQRVTDLLDLRHLDAIVEVRAADLDTLATRTVHALSDREGLRGLVWALLTDPRNEVCGLGQQLITEIFVRACRDFGRGDVA